jgi:hypothetical protein
MSLAKAAQEAGKLKKVLEKLNKKHGVLKMIPGKVFWKALEDGGVTIKNRMILFDMGQRIGWWIGETKGKFSLQKEERETMLDKLMQEMREEAGLGVLDENAINAAKRISSQVGPDIKRIEKFIGFRRVSELPEDEQDLVYTMVRLIQKLSERTADMVQEVAKGARGSFDKSKKDYLKKVARDAGFGGTL